MSRREDLVLGGRALRALRAADVVRPAAAAPAAACDPFGTRPPCHAGGVDRDRAPRATRAATRSSTSAARSRGASSTGACGALAYALASTYGAGPGGRSRSCAATTAASIEALAGGGADRRRRAGAEHRVRGAAARGRACGARVAAVVHDAEFCARLDAPGDASARLVAWTDEPGLLAPTEALARAAVDLDGRPRAAARSRSSPRARPGRRRVPRATCRSRAMVGPIATLIEHLGLRRGEPVLVARRCSTASVSRSPRSPRRSARPSCCSAASTPEDALATIARAPGRLPRRAFP